MSSFVTEFKKYQKQERILTTTLVLVAVMSPVSFSWLLKNNLHWSIAIAVAMIFILGTVILYFIRGNVSEILLKKYESLDVGSVLLKKISPNDPRKFVVTNRGYNHFYLRCLHTGEQVLVSKRRVREDFDIAN